MIRVLLADDHLLIREALVLLLETEDGIEVVADVGRGDEAVERVRTLRPDVAVLDIDMPGMDGLAAAERLSREAPGCRLIIVTAHGRPGNLRRAMAAGVRGFLGKDAPGAQLATVIRQVAGGARYIDPQLAADALAAEECPLTPRELDALRAAADGAPISRIARGMGLSEGTVRNYLSAAVTKLGADNRHAAVRAARDHGWI
ncbi:two component transcriptional regulator, LuxR family [Thermomonospora echinospora]|uniref:Two component transcriptional regulator, LuxR family n=1 Tax=Thermomonospora echinospora TaxID=1992 RepID=A0A1H5XVS8_9ACTN|nr:response regulator transcription factor [Thermomonospora echinospora]SEG15500.1 two component transcriptional regulator, LuxR family [Thermomonospora echinospora]